MRKGTTYTCRDSLGHSYAIHREHHLQPHYDLALIWRGPLSDPARPVHPTGVFLHRDEERAELQAEILRRHGAVDVVPVEAQTCKVEFL